MMLNAAFLRPDINFLHVKQYALQHVHPICAPGRTLKFKSHSIAYQGRTIPPLRAGSLSFSPFLHGQHRGALKLSQSADGDSSLARSAVVSRASKVPALFTYPPMTTKPKWWWRTLACTPYLLPLHLMWLHAVTAYHLHRLLENWDFLVNPFIDTITLMPNWLMMALIFAAYYLVVRRKEWPHFLRFHVIMAMLLENGYQAIAIACTWLPNTFYRGKLGMTFWLAVTFMQLYTVVECMRSALNGMYADVPFVSDTAYLHSDLKLF
ncbi:protein TIC 20-I, chloroplastic-like isoform X1 [Curcuma longa]|uniref:protein TIC 20-I, chloroplastic-like isoform X1 n=1 Tax=Curcuma longa TaxID=136217 RepID=UPI003D9FB0BF